MSQIPSSGKKIYAIFSLKGMKTYAKLKTNFQIKYAKICQNSSLPILYLIYRSTCNIRTNAN